MHTSFSDLLYGNIGKKIKLLAKVSAVLVTLMFFIIGAVVIGSSYGDGGLILLGVLFMILSPIVGWLSSLIIYAFGELVDKVCDIEKNTRTEKSPSNEPRDAFPEL